MKVLTKTQVPQPPKRLVSVDAGSVVKMKKRFSDRHRYDDLFIVTAVCNSYVPECVKRSAEYPHPYDRNAPARDSHYAPPGCSADGYDGFGKVALTNLRTGILSYVTGDRECQPMDAAVHNFGALR
jgi:hypothetical protein